MDGHGHRVGQGTARTAGSTILQARPETVKSRKKPRKGRRSAFFLRRKKSEVLATRPRHRGNKIGAGTRALVKDALRDGAQSRRANRIVHRTCTDPNWEAG